MADIICANTSFSEVKSKLASAVSGDRVLIPAGTVTITKTIASTDPFASGEDTSLGNKAIMIEGGYGGGETIFLDAINQPSVNYGVDGSRPQMIYWITIDHATHKTGFKNITFQGSNSPQVGNNGMVMILGNTSKWLLYNCRIITTVASGFFFGRSGDGYIRGVNCYNTWHCSDGPFACYTFHSSWGNVGSYGDNSWAQAHTMGSSEALFFENETFTNDQGVVEVAYALDGWNGLRRVIRHCTFVNCISTDHGTESGGRQRSSRQREEYNNTFNMTMTNANWPSVLSTRGGTGLYYNNAVNVTGPNTILRVFDMTNQRNDLGAVDEMFYIFAWAGKFTPTAVTFSGTSVTVTLAVPVSIPNASTKSHSFNSTDDFVEMRGFSPSQYNGIWQVTGFTNTTVTFSVASTPSSTPTVMGQIMNPWDGNSDVYGHRCIDQVGSGASVLIAGDVPTPPNAGAGGTSGMNQGLEPVFAWANTINGSNSGPVINGSWSANIIQQNRDYYARAPQSGDAIFPYVAYTYPHPFNPGAPAGGGGASPVVGVGKRLRGWIAR